MIRKLIKINYGTDNLILNGGNFYLFTSSCDVQRSCLLYDLQLNHLQQKRPHAASWGHLHVNQLFYEIKPWAADQIAPTLIKILNLSHFQQKEHKKLGVYRYSR